MHCAYSITVRTHLLFIQGERQNFQVFWFSDRYLVMQHDGVIDEFAVLG